MWPSEGETGPPPEDPGTGHPLEEEVGPPPEDPENGGEVQLAVIQWMTSITLYPLDRRGT